jgi:uncharacterized protein (TIGR02453 family)
MTGCHDCHSPKLAGMKPDPERMLSGRPRFAPGSRQPLPPQRAADSSGMTGDAFKGFPRDAFTFFAGLARNNNRDWFQAHRELYEEACRAPMKQLIAALGSDPARTKITRINRDMRFARGQAPYRMHIATGVGGRYLSLSAEGLYIGAGMYKPEGPTLERFRNAIAADASGRALQKLVTSLRRKGYRIDTHDRLASVPRGYRGEHPRADLLRMKDIHAGKTLPAKSLATGPAVARIKRAMADVEPLVDWLRAHVG